MVEHSQQMKVNKINYSKIKKRKTKLNYRDESKNWMFK